MINDLRLIIFVGNIPGINTGAGGHYYTALEHYNAFKKITPTKLVCIGDKIPSAFSNVDGEVMLVKCGKVLKDISVINEVRSLLLSENAVAHAFDSGSFYFLRAASVGRRFPILFTKCGGTILTRYTPSIHPDIVFHDEDYEHYKELGAPLPGRVFRKIPNRISGEFSIHPKPTTLSLFPDDSVNVLRIGRICEKYRSSFENSINLTERLVSEGVPAFLAIVGYPQDPTLVESLRVRLRDIGEVYTDSSYTSFAKRHIVEADVVVASGRGVMESAFAGKITMFSVRNRNIPILLDKDTIKAGLHFNFSERSVIDFGHDSFYLVKQYLGSLQLKAKYLRELEEISTKLFSIDYVIKDYLRIYHNLSFESNIYSVRDIIRHFFWVRLVPVISRTIKLLK